MRYHPIYKVWNGVKNRCCNPKNVAYKYYGGGVLLFAMSGKVILNVLLNGVKEMVMKKG